MPKYEVSYMEMLENSKAHGVFVKKNQQSFEEEDTATLKSLSENWTFVSQDGNVVRLENRSGAIYDFDVTTHHFTRVISAEEREQIEKEWPKA